MEINFNMMNNLLLKKILKWGLLAVVIGYVAVVIIRIPHFYSLKKTEEQVVKIHATKLTLVDVMGENLPADPGPLADQTIEGVDANQNGIRDDVELAIFAEYPNSAKTRAVLLQYALALQMGSVQDFVNTTIVTEVVREQSRAYACVGEILSRDNLQDYIKESDELRSFVKDLQFNTDNRKEERNNFLEKVGSYSESINKICDINLSTLDN